MSSLNTGLWDRDDSTRRVGWERSRRKLWVRTGTEGEEGRLVDVGTINTSSMWERMGRC